MTYRARNIGLAVILAAFAGLLTIFYVANYKRNVQHGEKTVSVLVAARDIPAGTAGSEVVGQQYLTTQSIPRRAVMPGAISSADQLRNLVVTQPVFRGEQISTRSFGTQGELGVRAQLRGSDRVLQLAGDANELLAGTLKDGDQVDVLATFTSPEGSQHHVSKVIVRDLLVLKAPEIGAGAKLGASDQSTFVQLRASDSEMQKIYWARKNGALSLLLRPPTHAQNGAWASDDANTLLRSH